MTPMEFEAGGGGWEFGRGGAEEFANDESLLILLPKPIDGVFPALLGPPTPPVGPLPLDPG